MRVSTAASKDFDHTKDSYLLKHIIHSLLPDSVHSRGPGRIHRRLVNEAGESEGVEMGRHFHAPAIFNLL